MYLRLFFCVAPKENPVSYAQRCSINLIECILCETENCQHPEKPSTEYLVPFFEFDTRCCSYCTLFTLNWWNCFVLTISAMEIAVTLWTEKCMQLLLFFIFSRDRIADVVIHVLLLWLLICMNASRAYSLCFANYLLCVNIIGSQSILILCY